jgi:hypothetical protein
MRVICVFTVQTFSVVVLYFGSYKHLPKNKLAFSFVIIGQIFRLALYALLIVEVTFAGAIPQNYDITIGNVTFTLILVIISCNILQIITTFMGGFWIQENIREIK